MLSDAKLAYERREELPRRSRPRASSSAASCCSVIDRRWRDHLYEMDYLKDGIGLRAMAQRDPLVEYQREGFALFQTMMGAIREESVGFLFNLEVEVTGGAQVARRAVSASRATRPQRSVVLGAVGRRAGRGRGAQPARPARAGGHRSARSSSRRRRPRRSRQQGQGQQAPRTAAGRAASLGSPHRAARAARSVSAPRAASRLR